MNQPPRDALALLASVDDPELAAIVARCYPSEEREATLALEREAENSQRRAERLRQLRTMARDAAEGVYGTAVRDAARAILEEGRSEVHLQRVERAVRQWRRMRRGRAA